MLFKKPAAKPAPSATTKPTAIGKPVGLGAKAAPKGPVSSPSGIKAVVPQKPAATERKTSPSPAKKNILITSPEEIRQEVEAQKSKAASGSFRFNKFRITEGETKRIVFRDPEPLGAMHLHYASEPGNKYQTQHICTQKSRGDCAFCEAGMRTSFMFVWEIVDLTESRSKSGKVYKNQPRWLLLNNTQHNTLLAAMKMIKAVSPSKDPTRVVVEVSRVGSGAQTNYTYTTDGAPRPAVVGTVQRLNMEELAGLERGAQESVVDVHNRIEARKAGEEHEETSYQAEDQAF